MKMFNVVFCGTPDFSVPSLDLLYNHPLVDLKAVVTMPDRPAGRGQHDVSPPVAVFAKEKKITLFQTENINKDQDILNFCQNNNIDFIIVIAFAQFLSKQVLDLPKMGCFNIHTSLLPKYRGAAPIQYALLNGDNSTGVTIQKMVSKMDAGDICYSSKIPISPTENGGQLYTRLKFLAAIGLNDFIEQIANNKLSFSPQDENLVSFAPTLVKEDGILDFKNKTFSQLKNQVRGLDPWPGTFCFLNNKRLKVFSIEPSPEEVAPGETYLANNTLVIGCKDSAARLTQVQIEGKKRATDTELLNGLRNSESLVILSTHKEEK